VLLKIRSWKFGVLYRGREEAAEAKGEGGWVECVLVNRDIKEILVHLLPDVKYGAKTEQRSVSLKGGHSLIDIAARYCLVHLRSMWAMCIEGRTMVSDRRRSAK